MTPAKIKKVGPSEHHVLLTVWEASVRASHDFLQEQDIEDYRSLLASTYLNRVDLYLLEEDNQVKGFIGLSTGKIQLLFIEPKAFRRGYGTLLIDFAIKKKGAYQVDVNSQNVNAYQFYKQAGFRIFRKFEFDGAGKAYPVWCMTRNKWEIITGAFINFRNYFNFKRYSYGT
ncbi:GNAT family N-acetyltransferase [Pedobacter rhodius]|uniref:GNAT family N-acetyltransferase n=1 Tax=Pedobacter rhodius TaxID=3004098 RepID=A0ABT4KSJ2_9SPHI|nr:GNAT family N-acetyltransferase [Pedobacter sp. SJ11]MCZ4221901.1 GNAT family N-acetyltransferase [Pedobacter sp. SJ11]